MTGNFPKGFCRSRWRRPTRYLKFIPSDTLPICRAPPGRSQRQICCTSRRWRRSSCNSNFLELGRLLRLLTLQPPIVPALSASHPSGAVSWPPTPAPEKQHGSGPRFLLLSSAPASCGLIAEAVGTRQGSPLRCDERAEGRAALTEPASPLPAPQDMKRGHSIQEIWLRAKGKVPSFRISPHAGSAGEQTSCHTATIAMQPAGRASTRPSPTDRPSWAQGLLGSRDPLCAARPGRAAA